MKIVIYRNSDDSLYSQTLVLRDEILRRPQGFSIYDEDLSYETENIFFGAVIDGRLAGTVNYFVKAPEIAQLCAFAVRSDIQRQGIGRQLVAALFEELQQKNFKKCIVEARESAVEFYEKVGFRKDKMVKNSRVGMDWMMHRDLENL